MVKVSELISKRLIALNSAETVGTVENVIFDGKLTAGRFLKIYDDGGNDAEIRYAELRRVKNTDETCDACVISDKSFATTQPETRKMTENNPINKACFNQDGKSFGRVRDVILENTAVKTIIADETEFTPDKILSYSDKLIVVNDTGKPIRPYKPRRIKVPAPEKAAERTVSVHIATPQAINPDDGNKAPATKTFTAVSETPAAEKTDNVKLPARVPPENTVVTRTPAQDDNALSPYKFLIGKTLQKDIAADNGIVILRKYAVIDNAVIASAKDHGKLVQLALHAE